MLPHEMEFINTLRSVVVHLIKHDQPLYRDVIPILEAYDDHRWRDLPAHEKMRYVEDLFDKLDRLTQYYEQYPHPWSKQRFADFVAAFKAFAAELKQEA